jgi:hypothetical protein
MFRHSKAFVDSVIPAAFGRRVLKVTSLMLNPRPTVAVEHGRHAVGIFELLSPPVNMRRGFSFI